MPIEARDVIIIWDGFIKPPGPKLVMCLEPMLGYFGRINTRGHHPFSVALLREPHHRFLDHDSFVQCGHVLDLDEYMVEESISRKGIIGRVSATLCEAIVAQMKLDKLLDAEAKAAIAAAMNCGP